MSRIVEATKRSLGRAAKGVVLDPEKMPEHVAILLSGRGDEKGDQLREVIQTCRELGIRYVSLCGSREDCERLRDTGLSETGAGDVELALVSGRSRDELVDVARRIARDVRLGLLAPGDIDSKTVDRYLSATGRPDPDLLICTGSQTRLQDFLLWQVAYSELVVTDLPWTSVGRAAFVDALEQFQKRERRFGGVTAAPALSKAG